MNRLLLVFVVSVLVLGIPAQSLAVALDRHIPEKNLSELEMPSHPCEGPCNAAATRGKTWNETYSHSLAPVFMNLEEQQRLDEEKRRARWEKWSPPPKVEFKSAVVEKKLEPPPERNLSMEKFSNDTWEMFIPPNRSIQDIGKHELPKEVIEEKKRLMKYHKLDTPLAELAWRAENETELREKWVKVRIALKNASKDLSMYSFIRTSTFISTSEREVDAVYGYVKIGALAGLQKDPDIYNVVIPQKGEPVVVSEPPINESLGEAAEGATAEADRGICTATLVLVLLLIAIAIATLLWRRRK